MKVTILSEAMMATSAQAFCEMKLSTVNFIFWHLKQISLYCSIKILSV